MLIVPTSLGMYKMNKNFPYSKKEMAIIRAIYKIDSKAKFQIIGKVESRMDFLYGGIKWESEPISWEQVLEKMYEIEVNSK